MTALVTYGWPGNVRELEHAVERAVILARTTALRLEDLPDDVVSGGRDERITRGSGLDVHAHERALVEEALRRFKGNRKRAAKALGVSTVTLWRMIKRYGLQGGDRRLGESEE
jgi:two-component system response regulator HydG